MLSEAGEYLFTAPHSNFDFDLEEQVLPRKDEEEEQCEDGWFAELDLPKLISLFECVSKCWVRSLAWGWLGLSVRSLVGLGLGKGSVI